MRTISEPATASSLTWMAVPIASAVSVLVMDCTTTGASPPIRTSLPPQLTVAQRVGRFGAAPATDGQPSCTAVSLIVCNVLKPVKNQPGLRNPPSIDCIECGNDENGQYDDEPAPRATGRFGCQGDFSVSGNRRG